MAVGSCITMHQELWGCGNRRCLLRVVWSSVISFRKNYSVRNIPCIHGRTTEGEVHCNNELWLWSRYYSEAVLLPIMAILWLWGSIPSGCFTTYVMLWLYPLHLLCIRNYGCGAVYPEAVTDCKVLDLGSGAGLDCFVLSKLVGPEGHVTGIDMTTEQVSACMCVHM